MPLDLTGLTALQGYGKRSVEEAYAGEGDYPKEQLQQAYMKELNQNVFPKYAGAGYSPSTGDVQAAVAKSIQDSDQALRDAYARRRSAALTTAQGLETAPADLALREWGLMGVTDTGEPTLAAQQTAINKALAEGTLTGTYGGAPTLASQALTQQESQFGRTLTQQTSLATMQADLQRELQKGDLASREKIAQLTADIQRESLTQQESQFGRQLTSTEKTSQLNRDLQAEIAKGGWASAEKIAQLRADIEQEALNNLKSQQDLSLWGGLIGSVGQRTGLWDYLFGTTGTAGGAGGGGTGTTGLVQTALKKAYDLLTGAATTVPYLSTAPLTQEAFTAAQSLIAQGFPQNIAYEAANAATIEGLSPGGESIANYLANFNPVSNPMTTEAAKAAFSGTPEQALQWMQKTYPGEDFTSEIWSSLSSASAPAAEAGAGMGAAGLSAVAPAAMATYKALVASGYPAAEAALAAYGTGTGAAAGLGAGAGLLATTTPTVSAAGFGGLAGIEGSTTAASLGAGAGAGLGGLALGATAIGAPIMAIVMNLMRDQDAENRAKQLSYAREVVGQYGSAQNAWQIVKNAPAAATTGGAPVTDVVGIDQYGRSVPGMWYTDPTTGKSGWVSASAPTAFFGVNWIREGPDYGPLPASPTTPTSTTPAFPGTPTYDAARAFLSMRALEKGGWITPTGVQTGDLYAGGFGMGMLGGSGGIGYDDNRTRQYVAYLQGLDHAPTWDELAAFDKSIEPVEDISARVYESTGGGGGEGGGGAGW